jgi:AraC family transcriptional regulator, regulatory protein of adaptative response / DNA-3-methyladenine glycosylase II
MLEPLGLPRTVLDRARRSRDARFDGKFFIAVTSTRIYCRPICPAKTSDDANVRYYATAAEAAAAGFRPCLRCRPEAAPGSPAWLGTSAVVRRALRMIQDGALDDSSLERLSERLGVGARHLTRLFVRHLGASPAAIARTRRLHFAKQLLDETNLPITAIALASGFRSVRRFNDVFKATYRRPPREMRKGLRTGRRHTAEAEIRLQLTYRPPYDWPHLLEFLAARAIPGLESIREGSYTRAMRVARGHALLQVAASKGAHALELRIRGGESSDLLPLASAARRMFDLAADPARIAAVLYRDPRLKVLVTRRPGLRIPGVWGAFETAVRAIVSQRMSAAAARSRLARLVECAGEHFACGQTAITHLFPTPDRIAEANLEQAGIPSAQAESLRRLAAAVRDGSLALDEPSAETMQALTDIGGVGPWVAGYVALCGLGDPDAFPAGDPVLRRRASPRAALLSEPQLDALAERWRPFRGYAVLHLWQASSERSRLRRPRRSRTRPDIRGPETASSRALEV